MAHRLGNTIRLRAIFQDWDGQPSDPDDVSVRIYSASRKLLRDVLLTSENRLETGVWFYDHLAPGAGTYIFEFWGLLDGSPSLNRSSFCVIF